MGVVKKKSREAVAPDGEVIASGVRSGFTDKNGTVFFAFATNDELAAVEVDRVAIKPDEFRDAEAAGKEKFDNGAVAETGLGVIGDSV